MAGTPVFRSSFTSAEDETNGLGKRPIVFDILGPDWETSLLPDDLKIVMHVNPTSMQVRYTRTVERIQTRGGFVEQHWGDAPSDVSFENVTGGFMRLYTGLSNNTNPKYGGTRRETIAYDKFLDMLALFHNNGAVYDTNGNIVLQGILKMTFDGGVWLGWFSEFSRAEAAEKPFQFTFSSSFQVQREWATWRSTVSASDGLATSQSSGASFDIGTPPLGDV